RRRRARRRGARPRSGDANPERQRQGEDEAREGPQGPEEAQVANTNTNSRTLVESPSSKSALHVLGDDGRRDAAADVERGIDTGAARADRRHQIVQDAVGDRFVERALVAVRPEIELPGFELDAERVGHVFDADSGEVRLPGLRAEAGELRAVEADDVIAL